MGASRTHLKNCFNEGYGRFRVDRVAVGAQASHTAGNPMSQRECAGFNWPGFSVSAGDPFGVGPEACERACLHRLAVCWLIPDPFASAACGATQPATNIATCSFSGRALWV